MNRLAIAASLLLLVSGSAQDPPADKSVPAARALAVRGLEQGDPFKLTAQASDAALTLELSIDAGWHLYGRDTGGGVPVRLAVLPGSCFEAAGELQAPADAKGEITGKAKLVLPLRRTAPGNALRARFSFMACDALQCLPPREVELETRLRVLVVTPADAPHRARLEKLLSERGFDCTLREYKGLTAEECERHDVVVADSPNPDEAAFRAAMKQRAAALAFPRTRAPIVAVGYLGTVLLEAHKIAMACGYI
jgi:hypothetical protein